MKIPLILTAFVLSVSALLATSRSYMPLDRLIEDSDVIAIVVVGETSIGTPHLNPDRLSPYRQSTAATVVRELKGDLPKEIAILHFKELDDSLFQQGRGEYLVFLNAKGTDFVPADGWPSSKPIRDGYVIGWSDSHSWSVKDLLENALARIGRAQ